ncbi:uncharacterized protein [Apostichopus japonicus]|uniref:uncharacterized protein n=1 Tax=Stichopus japonicus TaxID=307972 RepID=UPI003AB540DC
MLCAVRLVLCMMTLCYLQALHPWLQSLAFELPNPRLDFKLCGGDLTEPKWICDPDHVLHEPEVNKINRILESIRYNTTCACDDQSECPIDGTGFTVSVAIKSSLPTRSRSISATNYAKYLRQNEWKFSACDDDVVIVIANKKREIGISYGFTTEQMLAVIVIDDILRNSRNIFERRNISETTMYLVSSLKDAFLGNYRRTPPFPVWTVVHMILGSSFVLCCFCSMYICRVLYSQ